MGWLIALAVIAGLAILPLGVSAQYADGGATVRLMIGPLRFLLYPGKGKKTKKTAKGKANTAAQTKKTENKGGSLSDFLPVVRAVLDFLVDFRRKIRVDTLQLQLTLAGGDPCDLAVNYGKAWAAIEGIMPQIDRYFVIKERKIDVACDFVADSTTVYARLDITITLCRLLAIALRHGTKVLREFTRIAKLRKGGALQ